MDDMIEGTSIFTIERRKDFPKAYTAFFEDLQTMVTTTSGKECKMFVFLEHCIRFWPHRCGAAGIDDYLKGIDIDIKNPKEDKELLLTLELLINLLHWAPQQDINDKTELSLSFDLSRGVESEANRMLDNADYILEQCCNMKVRVVADEAFPKYYITKRNVNVDIAAMAVPKLSDILLGYFDIRNEADIEFKKNALIAIYEYLEPRRKDLKQMPWGNISEEFFADMNSFRIRHKDKNQVSLRGKKKAIIFDKLFMMAVYMMQGEAVSGYKEEMKGLRDKK